MLTAVSYTHLLTCGRNKNVGTLLQLECELLPNDKSEMEPTTAVPTDEYTTDLPVQRTEYESSTMTSSVSDNLMYTFINMRENKIPFTSVPCTYETTGQTKTKHSESDNEDNVLHVADTSHSPDLSAQDVYKRQLIHL